MNMIEGRQNNRKVHRFFLKIADFVLIVLQLRSFWRATEFSFSSFKFPGLRPDDNLGH